MKTMLRLGTALALVAGTGTAAFAGPEVVAGPGADPECFAPWSADTKYLQWPAKEGPYRIAIVNGFVGNTWRIQMIKTAKAYAEDPAVKDKIAELKVVSTGTDAPAQLGAIEDFINQGFDAIVTIAVSPDGFDRVIRLADKNDVVIVPFDNVLDTDAVMQVNEDQLEMGRKWAQFLVDELKAAGQDRRQDPRGPRPARQLGRPRPLDRHPRGVRRHRRRVGGGAGRRQLGRRHRPEGHRRRHRRARPVRRRHRPGRLDRHRAGDDGRRPPVRAGRRRVARTASAS